MKSPQDSNFGQLISRVIGQPIGLGAPYGTDGGQFQTLGINSYICGPGSLSEAHQPNESLELAALIRGQEVVEQVLQGWCVEETRSGK
jgi:acetylornithine deacetylase